MELLVLIKEIGKHFRMFAFFVIIFIKLYSHRNKSINCKKVNTKKVISYFGGN